jgi:hypothetical protein
MHHPHPISLPRRASRESQHARSRVTCSPDHSSSPGAQQRAWHGLVCATTEAMADGRVHAVARHETNAAVGVLVAWNPVRHHSPTRPRVVDDSCDPMRSSRHARMRETRTQRRHLGSSGRSAVSSSGERRVDSRRRAVQSRRRGQIDVLVPEASSHTHSTRTRGPSSSSLLPQSCHRSPRAQIGAPPSNSALIPSVGLESRVGPGPADQRLNAMRRSFNQASPDLRCCVNESAWLTYAPGRAPLYACVVVGSDLSWRWLSP